MTALVVGLEGRIANDDRTAEVDMQAVQVSGGRGISASGADSEVMGEIALLPSADYLDPNDAFAGAGRPIIAGRSEAGGLEDDGEATAELGNAGSLQPTAEAVADGLRATDEGRSPGEALHERPEPGDVPAMPIPDSAAVLGASGDAIRDLICSYDWPCGEALAVVYGPTPPNAHAPNGCANGESGGNPGAIGDGSIGLLQIQAYWHLDKLSRIVGYPVETVDEAVPLLLDAAINVAVGYEIWKAGGGTFLAWSCRP